MPTPYTMKFIIMVWLAFFARQSPVSTIANPACMNMTRKPVTSVQTKLIAMPFWPDLVHDIRESQSFFRVGSNHIADCTSARASRIALGGQIIG